jgi:integrase
MASGKLISRGVIRNYEFALQLLLQYEATLSEPLRIMSLNKASMAETQKEARYWQKFFDGFSRFLYNFKGHGDNYVSGIFKIVKTVFNHLRRKTGLQTGEFHRGFRLPTYHFEPVVLLPEQLHFLISSQDFHESLPAHLRRTKDIFILGCTTGLRVSDLMGLKSQNLLTLRDEIRLVVHTRKTGTRVEIPLPAYCVEIIKRYRRKAGNYALPRLSSTNLNIQIKELGRRAGWDWPVAKYCSRKGKLVEQKNPKSGESWKFYQHLTTHTMRRTAITSLLMLGVEEAVVRKISGHAAGSKEFFRYIALAQSYMDNQVRLAHKRLAESPDIYRNPG